MHGWVNLVGIFASFDPVASASTAPDAWTIARYVCAPIVAALLLWIAFSNMVRKLSPTPQNLGNFVAFNAVAATVVGTTLIVLATKQWMGVLLAAGASLGIGFIFGLLFGYPLSNKPAAGAAQPGNAGQVGNVPAGKAGDSATITSKTLFQQSADALSKVIAGATLVKAKAIYGYFLQVAAAVSWYADSEGKFPGSKVFGSAVTLYFLVLGFLAGLLLPHFYDLIEAVPGSGDGADSDDKSKPGVNAVKQTSVGGGGGSL